MTWTWQTAMDAKLPTFAGWHFMVGCTTCRILVQREVDALCPTHAERTVAEIVMRLRCSRCGAELASLVLASGHHGDGRGEPQQVKLYP